MDRSQTELVAALKPYEEVARARGLREITIESHVMYARRFLRWRIGKYVPRGATPRSHQSGTVRRATIEDLRADLVEYARALRDAKLRPAAVTTYVEEAGLFVQWLAESADAHAAEGRASYEGDRAADGVRANTDYRKRIRIIAGKRGGQPTIRGLRVTVADVLSYLAAGMTEDQILSDFPDLQRDDIRAALAYAADRERRRAVVLG